jgi:hypothetical protein
MKISIEKIRRVLAVVMLTTFFLPLTQCTPKQASAASAAPSKPSVYVAAESMNWREPKEWSPLLLFVWPLPSLALLAGVRRRAVRIATHALELLACAAATYYAVMIIGLWGEIRYGGVILLASLLLYFGFTAYCLRWQIRNKAKPQT